MPELLVKRITWLLFYTDKKFLIFIFSPFYVLMLSYWTFAPTFLSSRQTKRNETQFCLVCTMKISVLTAYSIISTTVPLTHLNSHCQALILTFHNKAALRSFRNILHKRKMVSTHTWDAGKRDYSHVQLTKTHHKTPDSLMKHHMSNMDCLFWFSFALIISCTPNSISTHYASS